MILHQQNLDYSKNCKYTFGTYVQAHDEPEPKNNLSPRTLDCIYLRYKESHQGGHELLHIPTNKVITRRTTSYSNKQSNHKKVNHSTANHTNNY